MRALILCMILLPVAAMAQDDRGYIQGLLEDALSAEGREVRVEGFAGALSSRATIDRITVSDADGIWLDIDNAALTWTRSALLSGRIEIDEIAAERLTLSRAPLPEPGALPSATAPGRFQLPSLPVSLNLGALAVSEVVLGAPLLGEEVTLNVAGSAQLEAGAGRAELTITRLDKGGEVSLSGGFDNTTRVLSLELSAQEPAGGIAARQLGLPGQPSTRLQISGTAPINDYTADIALATDGQDRLTGQVTLMGEVNQDRLFRADLSGDLAPVLAPEYRAFLGPRVGLQVSGAQRLSGALELDDLTLTADALRLTGSARIAPDGWPQSFDLQGDLGAGGAPILLPIPGPQTRVLGADISARFDAETGDRWSLRAELDGFDRPDLDLTRLALNGDGVIARDTSQVSGAIVLDASGIAPADAALARALGPGLTGALQFDWQNGAPLTLSEMTLGGADYGLQGAVSFDGITDDLNLRIRPDLRLRADNLSRFAGLAGADITGAAQLQIAGEVEPLAGLVDLTLGGETRDLTTGIAQLDPLLRGAGRLDARVSRDESGTALSPLRIITQAAQITAEGRLQPDGSTLRLDAGLTNVADVLRGLNGPASLNARAAQSGARWDVDATVTAPGDTVARFDGAVTGDGIKQLLLDGVLTASVDRLSTYARLVGQPIGGAVSLRAEGRGDALRQSFTGSARVNGTSLRSGIAQLDALLVGPSTLRTEASYSNATARFDRLVLEATGLSLDASGSLSADAGDLRLSTQIANLGRLVPDLPGPASLSGTARRSGGPWSIDVSANGPGGITLDARGTAAADASRFNMALNGVAPLALANPRITPRTLDGLLNFNLALNGPPALSSLSGTLRSEAARLSLPTLRNAVEQIALTAQLSGARAQIDASGRFAKGGDLSLSGPIGLEPPFNADLAASVSNLQLEQAGLFQTTANGRVTVSGGLLGGAGIGGRIGLETVEARLPNFGPSYQALEGLRHVNPPADVLRTLQFAGLTADGSQAEGPPLPSYPIDLVIDAPNRIFVRGRGLDAELGGSLRLLGTTDDLRPQGSFNLVRGRLDLLGRRLVLSEGAVSLRGSFDPFIRLAATTDIDDTAITVSIEGPVNDPQLIVQSSPDLPQEEALSLLLFGRELTSISPLQAVQLAQAIRTLSGRGGGGVLEQVRTGLRIDDLDIGTNAEGTAQARIGAYVSRNVYTDVTVTADGDSEINLNLDVTNQLTIKGRLGSDGDTGIGLFFERDY